LRHRTSDSVIFGYHKEITNAIAGDFTDSFYSTGVEAFTSQGKSYGLPDSVGPIVFWYKKELCEKAGVDLIEAPGAGGIIQLNGGP
jgi:maltose-binding protein MalE